ncbi:unnamed protein product [Polarella glacialis]|uniref:Uncharacterized protein n=1 Tax=Polarella glacialis TaxID=89957 RepID=A0A813M4Q7_POLGL|nr:unnamed protein product [Polarella glacialis]
MSWQICRKHSRYQQQPLTLAGPPPRTDERACRTSRSSRVHCFGNQSLSLLNNDGPKNAQVILGDGVGCELVLHGIGDARWRVGCVRRCRVCIHCSVLAPDLRWAGRAGT